jgi:hypothetical protein
MSGPQGADDRATEAAARERARRRARVAEVFGDVLPESTTDDRDPDVRRDDAAADAWLRAQVPPHHGGS